MSRKLQIFILLITSFGTIYSCTKDELPFNECGTTISYSQDVVPIINSSCISGLGPGVACHDAWITTYDGLIGAVNNGTFQSSTLETKIMPKMPNDYDIDDLTIDELDILRCWIIQGYPDN